MLNFKKMVKKTKKELNSDKPIVLTDEMLKNAFDKIKMPKGYRGVGR